MSYKLEFPCSICSKLHTKTLPNKSSAVQNILQGKVKIYCSKQCKRADHQTKRVYKACSKCGKEFRYFQSEKSKKFCSKKCYYEDMKDSPETYKLQEKVANMRKYIDKEDATEKMLQTKADRGLLIDWKISEWKQYWRKCNDLTRKIRNKMLEDWDGYDYIDGEYIRDNLNLPHSHGDYPTLDHIIPRSDGFKRGLTPQEITTSENLKWTKRRNNSKKNNKI